MSTGISSECQVWNKILGSSIVSSELRGEKEINHKNVLGNKIDHQSDVIPIRVTTGVVSWERWGHGTSTSPIICRRHRQMRGARGFSIDVIRVARECRWRIWYVWQNRLRDKVRSVRVRQLLVRVNTALHAKTASGTRRKVISAARLAWIVCQRKNIILWLNIEIGAILEWGWHVGGLYSTVTVRYRNFGMNTIDWRKTWGQVYWALRSRDMQTWRCKWFRHDWGFEAISNS